MTVRDMIEDGVAIEGALRIAYWDDDLEDSVLLYDSRESGSLASGTTHRSDALDNEIIYMYPEMTFKITDDGDDIEIPGIVIEVRKEN